MNAREPMSLRSETNKMQRGFSIVSAIFLLVVIATLGTFAVTLSTTQQQSSATDMQGAQAYQAARAGIEWGAYQVLRNGGICNPTTPLPALPGTLSGFTGTVKCTPTGYNEDGVAKSIYQITSTASQGALGTPGRVEREISVTIAPP